MASTDVFKRMFKGMSLEIEDLYLLEAFQKEVLETAPVAAGATCRSATPVL